MNNCTIGTLLDCNPFEMMFAFSICAIILVIARLLHNGFSEERKERAIQKAIERIKQESVQARQKHIQKINAKELSIKRDNIDNGYPE